MFTRLPISLSQNGMAFLPYYYLESRANLNAAANKVPTEYQLSAPASISEGTLVF